MMSRTRRFSPTTGALCDDPGSDFSIRRNPDNAKRRAIEQLRVMGYTVTIEPAG